MDAQPSKRKSIFIYNEKLDTKSDIRKTFVIVQMIHMIKFLLLFFVRIMKYSQCK